MANWFVDFGATNDGDGTAYNQAASGGAVGAFKTIVGKTFTSGDIVWIRRSTTALTISAQYTSAVSNLTICGWPIAGDDLYSTRPSSAQASWDADATQYALFNITLNSNANIFAMSGSSLKWYRCELNQSTATTSAGGVQLILTATGNNFTAKYMRLLYSAAGSVGTTSLGIAYQALYVTGLNPYLSNIYIKSVNGATVDIILAVTPGASSGVLQNIVIDVQTNVRTANSSTYGIVYLNNGGSNKPIIVKNLTINYLYNYVTHQQTAIAVPIGSAKLYNVTINGQTNSTYEGPGIYLATNDCKIYNLQSTGSMGTIYMAGSDNVIEATGWNVTYPMTGAGLTYTTGGITSPIVLALSGKSGNTLILKNSVLTTTGGGAKIYNAGNGSKVIGSYTDYVYNSINKTGTNNSVDYDFWWYNYGKTLGAFLYENRFGNIVTSNVYRTGGSSYSLKCTTTDTTIGQNKYALLISTKERPTIYVDLTAGSNTLTLYGAYKSWAGTNITAPTNEEVGFMFSWLNNSNVFTTTSTDASTALVSDSSTWNNDTGLTVFKCTVTIANAIAQTVPITIYCSPDFDATGFIYIDPAIVKT